MAMGRKNMFDEIKELKSLLDEGLITQEEFDERKGRILGNSAASVAGGGLDGAGTSTKSNRSDRQNTVKRLTPYLFLGVGALCLLVGLLFPMPGEDLTTYDLNGAEYFHIEEYVGGDAYNYIIGACILGGHISGAMTAKAVFAVGGLAFICVGVATLAIFGSGMEKSKDMGDIKMKDETTANEDRIEVKDA